MQTRKLRNMARDIAKGMEDIHDDDLVRSIQKDQEMLPGHYEPKVFDIINENCATPTMGPVIQNTFTAVRQFGLVKLCLSQPESFDRPSGDFSEAGFRTTGQPKRSVHERARTVAKALRIASLPLPSAKIMSDDAAQLVQALDARTCRQWDIFFACGRFRFLRRALQFS